MFIGQLGLKGSQFLEIEVGVAGGGQFLYLEYKQIRISCTPNMHDDVWKSSNGIDCVDRNILTISCEFQPLYIKSVAVVLTIDIVVSKLSRQMDSELMGQTPLATVGLKEVAINIGEVAQRCVQRCAHEIFSGSSHKDGGMRSLDV